MPTPTGEPKQIDTTTILNILCVYTCPSTKLLGANLYAAICLVMGDRLFIQEGERRMQRK